ncbi:hypothetical protein BGI05_02695 [Snodgrassella alvi]|uniref:DUF4224 domain-containing protein n=1 Tax=Snodgrassella alvi TaxID=1196083 RepID=UPI0009FE3935|nr:DUF4224 domain-containing protein [Snodgrassella alvi]ORF02469.1 hypothetical protein BGH97_04830 [Snodgrassella alvi]ORF09987.1 hypothetical protein BGH99_00355 [Snodgrassella alvi]ORF16011.1 hypothetical protein BGI00_00165 [Snodgrassella alvi]ORF16520.1 hypothetical protein BGI02_00155 [Snodgrassella alvi]ORF22210.1 hypothetical protein BGI05_02695 [Snodgrassella alvi]
MSEKSPYDEFLTREEVSVLTGYKSKGKQINQLKKQGIPFRLNGRNEPIVLRQSLLGNKHQSTGNPPARPRWQSPVLSST